MTDLTTRIAVAIHGATPPNPDAALALHRDAAERVLPVVEAEVARLRAAVEGVLPDSEGIRSKHFLADDCGCSFKDCYECGKWHDCSHGTLGLADQTRAALATAEEPGA